MISTFLASVAICRALLLLLWLWLLLRQLRRRGAQRNLAGAWFASFCRAGADEGRKAETLLNAQTLAMTAMVSRRWLAAGRIIVNDSTKRKSPKNISFKWKSGLYAK